LSPQELEFLNAIGKVSLIEQPITPPPAAGITIIDKIDGSYFTVMGLPIHLVYQHLISFV